MPHWCNVPELSHLPHEIQKKVAIPSKKIDVIQPLFAISSLKYNFSTGLKKDSTIGKGGNKLLDFDPCDLDLGLPFLIVD